MKMYICCPDKGCGTFQATLNFLKHRGIEPAILQDEDGYYFEFTVKSKRLYWEVCQLTMGMGTVWCRCGKWMKLLEEGGCGEAYEVTCKDCGWTMAICSDCDPITDIPECVCRPYQE